MSAAAALAALDAALTRAPLGARPPMEAARRQLAEALDGWTSASASVAALDAATGALRVATEAAEALTLAPHRGAGWPSLRWEARGDGGPWRAGLATLDAAHTGRGVPPSAVLAAWGVTVLAAGPHAASVLAALDGWTVRVEAAPGDATPRVQLRAPGGAAVAEAARGELPASAPLLRVTPREGRRGTPEALTLECAGPGRSDAPGWPAWHWRAQLAAEALRALDAPGARERASVLASLTDAAESLARGGPSASAALTLAGARLAAASASASHLAALYPAP